MTRHQPHTVSWKQAVLPCFVLFFVIATCVATGVPGINESHYLTKAKHAFDASFAPGDLFLESGDSHLAATWFAGVFTRFLTLEQVAWVGRALAWGLMAWAWFRFSAAVGISVLLSPFALASWILAVHYGHWAGEWTVGGFEGKAFAYPLVLLGVANVLEGRWPRAWVWFAAAIVWHPLVGGWAGLSGGILWLSTRDAPPIYKQLPWVAAAMVISLVGIWPALMGIRSPDPSGIASQVHVYYRLDHHLRPTTFSEERNLAATITLFTFLAVNLAWLAVFAFGIIKRRRNAKGESKVRDHATESTASDIPLRASGRLLLFGWVALAFALVGWVIDSQIAAANTNTHQPILASKLLRFYWFRWADAVVPLAWTAVLWQGLSWTVRPRTTSTANASKSAAMLEGSPISKAGVAIAVSAVLIVVGNKVYSDWRDTIPPADKILMENVGERREIEWDGGVSNRHTEWLAACQWIRDNTPTDSLWLTPRYQQSFKWYAQRAEVVCWKDVPQDNASVIAWYERVNRLQPKRTPSGLERGWTDAEFQELQEEYGFEYALIDRTFYAPHEPPPNFELLYPIDVDNRSFAVFRIR